MGMTRHLPLVSDRDRISAARYASMKLQWHMLQRTLKQRPKRKPAAWSHFLTLHGSVISERYLETGDRYRKDGF